MEDKDDILICSEVVDTPESLVKVIKLNKIRQEQIRAIVIVWDENLNEGGKEE